MARKTNYEGDRFGDWVVMSKAPAVNSKRMWNVTNSQTDETRVVAQTELKNLENEDVPTSAEITARVLAGNHADNPFAVPAAAFEPVFREAPCPADEACEIVDGKHVVTEFGGSYEAPEHSNPFAADSDWADDFLRVDQEILDAELEASEAACKAELAEDDTDLRAAIRECMMIASDIQSALDRVLKLVVNQ